MTPAEIEHYAHQLAALTVTASRATTAAQLSEVHDALAETFTDVFELLSHDAAGGSQMLVDLNRAIWRDWEEQESRA